MDYEVTFMQGNESDVSLLEVWVDLKEKKIRIQNDEYSFEGSIRAGLYYDSDDCPMISISYRYGHGDSAEMFANSINPVDGFEFLYGQNDMKNSSHNVDIILPEGSLVTFANHQNYFGLRLQRA